MPRIFRVKVAPTSVIGTKGRAAMSDTSWGLSGSAVGPGPSPDIGTPLVTHRTAAFGTKQTSQSAQRCPLSGGIADIAFTLN
jgi:hypothetical protein